MISSAALPGPVDASAPRGRAAEVSIPTREGDDSWKSPNAQAVSAVEPARGARCVPGSSRSACAALTIPRPRSAMTAKSARGSVAAIPTEHESPALAIGAPGGASKTAIPTTRMPEATIYGSQHTRARAEDHDRHQARRENRDDHSPDPGYPERRWLQVTAAVDLAAAVHGALDVPDVDLPHRAVAVRDAVEGVVTDEDAQAAAEIINGGGSR